MHDDDMDTQARRQALQSILGGSKAAMLGKKIPQAQRDKHALVIEILLGPDGAAKDPDGNPFEGDDDNVADKILPEDESYKPRRKLGPNLVK